MGVTNFWAKPESLESCWHLEWSIWSQLVISCAEPTSLGWSEISQWSLAEKKTTTTTITGIRLQTKHLWTSEIIVRTLEDHCPAVRRSGCKKLRRSGSFFRTNPSYFTRNLLETLKFLMKYSPWSPCVKKNRKTFIYPTQIKKKLGLSSNHCGFMETLGML